MIIKSLVFSLRYVFVKLKRLLKVPMHTKPFWTVLYLFIGIENFRFEDLRMTTIRKRFNWLTVFLHIILKKNRHLGKLHI